VQHSWRGREVGTGLDHIVGEVILDEDNPRDRREEQRANKLAANWALPGPLPAIPERVGQTWLTKVANTWGVHPIVVVRRLQNDGVLSWRSILAKDAPTVTNYLQDW
jgi:HTH-type transcriptional regulator/antitoxin HigA